MKKYGKYEKRPEGVPEKQPKVKSALLQTYFTSLLCMVLCVTMFFGTTYAWFTSEVTNQGNEIYIGTLDVDLQDVDGNSLKGDHPIFDGSIRWEPGYTALETIKVVNKGDLAFWYELTFVNNGTDSEILAEVAKNFVVYIHKGAYAAGEEVPKSFAEIETSAETDGAWQQIMLGQNPATLADILEKKISVISDSMSDVRTGTVDPTAQTPGPNDSKATEHTYIIALHMKEDADGKNIMGKKIQLNVRLEAYQRAYEEDGFDAVYDLVELKANVVELGEMDISCTAWIDEEARTMTLDAAYQFLPVESADEVQNSPYKNYIADFVVWSSEDVKANTIALAGYYDLFCSFNDDKWIALTADFDVSANEPIRLVQGLYPVTYEMLCTYGNDGIGFLCGIADLSENGENSGKIITVELRLYEVDETGEETGKYIVIGTPQTYTCE